MIPRFAAYLFDLDGTLIDSAPDIVAVQREILCGTPAASVSDAFLRGYIGRHLIELYGDLFPGCSAEKIEEWSQSYRSKYRARGHTLTRLFPGVAEALAGLDGKKATATTKGTETTQLVLEQFGIARYFHHVQGTDGFPHKPAPDVLLRSLTGLAADPKDALMIGDAPADIEAGKRAGVNTCAVRYGYGDVKALEELQPDYWIGDLRELIP